MGTDGGPIIDRQRTAGSAGRRAGRRAADSAGAAADDFYAIVDLRAVAADGLRSYLNGGLGESRFFDDQHDGVRLGSVSVGYHHDFLDIVHFTGRCRCLRRS